MITCLFDIDGTLLSSGGAGKSAMERALASTFGAPADSGGISYSGRTDRAIGRDLFRLHRIDESADNWRRFLDAYLSHLPDCLHGHQGRVLPGITSLLQELANRDDVLLGLLTGNVRAGARVKLCHFGLHDYFLLGGFGDDHFHRDDVAREALAFVHRHLDNRVDLDRLWVIGDTPLDVSCARAIGARVVAVATGWHSLEELATVRPDLLLTDLEDPLPLLRLLPRKG